MAQALVLVTFFELGFVTSPIFLFRGSSLNLCFCSPLLGEIFLKDFASLRCYSVVAVSFSRCSVPHPSCVFFVLPLFTCVTGICCNRFVSVCVTSVLASFVLMFAPRDIHHSCFRCSFCLWAHTENNRWWEIVF